MEALNEIPLSEIRNAADRLKGIVLRTPLIPLYNQIEGKEIFLKLENLQPIGSFKIRGSANAMLLAPPELLKDGVVTASAGNMAQGVAWNARRMNVACTVVVPDHAPEAKLSAIRRFGARIIPVPFDEWWNAMLTHRTEHASGFFVHPVSDPAVIAGNGTIGLEILEDLPDVDTILVPYGGGGLSSGIASAVKSIGSRAKIIACEVETAAPLSASFRAGTPQQVAYTPSFVDGIGAKSILPEMWPLVRKLIDEVRVAPLSDVADAVRTLLIRNHVLAEGAGATPVAIAMSGSIPGRKIVCVVSGGNIDLSKVPLHG